MSHSTAEPQTWVLKLGSSVLSRIEALPAAVASVYRFFRESDRVVVVVSAVGNTTDLLIRQAAITRGQLGPHEESVHLATLLATGEATATALMSLALQRAGLPARAISFKELSLSVRGSRMDADPVHCDTAKLRHCLDRGEIAVVPGFVGVHEDGQAALLGRGGSDLTALCVAEALDAQCRLLKDVNGLFTSDPTVDLTPPAPKPQRFLRCSFEAAEELPGEILQTKAAAFARSHRVGFSVGSLQGRSPTVVSGEPSELEAAAGSSANSNITGRLKIGLIGVGTVGGGVLDRLLESGHQRAFEIKAVGVRRPSEALDHRVPWMTPDQVLEQDLDVLVELVGGVTVAKTWVTQALSRGRFVVTANKDLVAQEFDSLLALSSDAWGSRLRYSAAVGGAAPLLERIVMLKRGGRVSKLRGVLNGTSNFVLERVHAGATEDQALSEARTLGLAEMSAERDLGGVDAADKIFLLARHTFGSSHQRSDVIVEPRPLNLAAAVQSAKAQGCRLRQVAHATEHELRVGYQKLPADDQLFAVSEANCVLVVQSEGSPGGSHCVRGAGAGRYPTTEAVLADLWDIHREHANRPVVDSPSAQDRESEVCT